MSDVRFSKFHEWVKIENDVVQVGITDYAQKQLGDIVFVELPQVGSKVERSVQLGTIESTKTASEFYAPLSGEVVEVNEDLVKNPQLINESPCESGWLVKIRIDYISDFESLMDSSAYQGLIDKEAS